MSFCWRSPVDPEDPHRDDRPSTPVDDALAAVALLLVIWCAVMGVRALEIEARHEAQATREHVAQIDR